MRRWWRSILLLRPPTTRVALDAKLTFDDNALFRHPDLRNCVMWRKKIRWKSKRRNTTNYIKLDGSVGCMVNGAVCHATMDIIKYPAACQPIFWTWA